MWTPRASGCLRQRCGTRATCSQAVSGAPAVRNTIRTERACGGASKVCVVSGAARGGNRLSARPLPVPVLIERVEPQPLVQGAGGQVLLHHLKIRSHGAP